MRSSPNLTPPSPRPTSDPLQAAAMKAGSHAEAGMPGTMTRAVFAVMAAAALFGTSATTMALLAPDASGPSVASMRLLVGSAGLVVVALARGRGRDLLRLWRMPLTWVMAAAVAGYQVLFFIGAQAAGVAVGTLVSLALAPFLAGVLGWLWREGAPGWVWAVSTVIAVAGVALLTGGAISTGNPWGLVASAGAGACYAVYTVIGVRLSRAGEHPGTVLAAAFAGGALMLLPFGVTSDWWHTPSGFVALLWLGLAATTGAYLLFGVGLAALQPGHIATLNLLEPVVATILGVTVVGEVLGMTGWAGCALIIVALALLGLADNRRHAPAQGDST